MTPFNVINDTHCGAIRSSGTTPRSAWQLRQYNLQQFGMLLERADGDLLINGDLLDTFSIPYTDLFEVYGMLRSWLAKGHDLYLPPGNHDLSKTTTTMSSFQFLCKLLESHPNMHIMDEPGEIEVAGQRGWVIPHVTNQDLFDIALSEVPPGIKYLFLHCNYDNKFAMVSDHSLNLSAEQARNLKVERIILGHEHQRNEHQAGKVLVVGNQIPTSIADCLGNDAKYMLRITDKIEWLPVWERSGSFERVDWKDAKSVSPDAQFIRVEGEASTIDAAAVASAISKLRSTHNAFVITNAVKIEGRDASGEKISLEQIQNYNILDALMKRLTPAQVVVVKKLMEENNVT
jgi:DNA repair exonuclease SbcCD nuclease subunit